MIIKTELLKNFLIRTSVFFFVAFAGFVTPGAACSTPVFRYALEMWAAYAYRVEVIHDGNLIPGQKQALEYLKAASSSAIPVNLLVIETVAGPAMKVNREALPLIRLSFPEAHKKPGVIWEGSLTEENVKKLVDSPSRKELVANIQNGDAAVWLFLPGGQTGKDARRLQVLEAALPQMSENLKLSETATDADGNPLDIKIINTGVSFSLVQIDRNDPAEEIFIKILLATEPDLKLFENVPMAFPVFGQGRELYALIDGGIKKKNIETACSTVIGWCSCTIKDDNPGMDLLLKSDWNLAIGDSSWIQPEQIPEITGISDFVEEKAEVKHNQVKEQPTAAAKAKEVTPDITTAPAEKPELQVEKEEVTAEPVVTLSSTGPEANQSLLESPLLRNILFAMALLLIIIVTASFLLKRT